MLKSVQYCENIENIVFDETKKYLILLAQQSKNSYAKLKKSNILFYGAIFPQIIFDNQNYNSGCLIITLEDSTQVSLIEDITKEIDPNIEEKLEYSSSLMVFVDGLSSGIQTFLENLYDILDHTCNIIGGGAGMLTLKQEPVIFNNHGIFENAALILSSSHGIHLGVAHGWDKIAGPFIVTHCEKNIVHSIDYYDAYPYYKELIQQDSDLCFENEDFFDISKNYPLGIERFNNTIVVRDPIAIQGNSLILVGEIEQNNIIYLLKGDHEKLIHASQNASLKANTTVQEFNFVVDCISRVLYLEDMFTQELEALKSGAHSQTSLFGVLSLGEIANNNNDYIEFYNKTCVVAGM
jgi:hypothetical protein